MRRYCVSLLDAKVDIETPAGGVRMTIFRGHRYLEVDAVVRHFPNLFAAPDAWRDAPAPAPHPNVFPL